jgi:hypothetical protein
VLEHDAQAGEAAPQRQQHLVDEAALAVEDVDLRIGDLAVDQQRQVLALHRFQRHRQRGCR